MEVLFGVSDILESIDVVMTIGFEVSCDLVLYSRVFLRKISP
jgi:hypothetical protein